MVQGIALERVLLECGGSHGRDGFREVFLRIDHFNMSIGFICFLMVEASKNKYFIRFYLFFHCSTIKKQIFPVVSFGFSMFDNQKTNISLGVICFSRIELSKTNMSLGFIGLLMVEASRCPNVLSVFLHCPTIKKNPKRQLAFFRDEATEAAADAKAAFLVSSLH